MANCVVANYLTPTNGDHINGVWKLTRALKKAGWIYKASGDATTKDTTGTASNDKWGGNADPLADTIPTLGSGSWWCAQGPSILKIPITSAATGTFARGENVTQGTTGAKGELLGVVYDIGSTTGWAVIAPRVDGSGGDPHGWDHTHAVTGDTSGASLTPSATVLEFVYEIVFGRKANLVDGDLLFQCLESVGENTSRFSYLAANAAGCTASVEPGGGGTGNSLPATGTWEILANQKWTTNSSANGQAIGRVQIMVANATPAAGVSGDGSFTICFGAPGVSAGSHYGFSLQRLDDTEDGDVCVYASWAIGNSSVNVRTATSTGGTVATASADPFTPYYAGRSSAGTQAPLNAWSSWRRRGVGSADTFVALETAMLACMSTGGQICTPIIDLDTAEPEKVSSDPGTTTYVAEALWLFRADTSLRVRKGTPRWWLVVQTGNGTDTWKSKTFVQFSNGVSGAFIIGPWDGSSTPVNS